MTNNIHPREITPERDYLSRRDFLKSIGIVSASAAVLAACAEITPPLPTEAAPDSESASGAAGGAEMDQLGAQTTDYEDVTNYNNFYEFTTDKQKVAKVAQGLNKSAWEISVGGLVENPKKYTITEMNQFGVEEHIHRMRCVEGWSMVIPWLGFPLNRLLADTKPTPEAKYVRFETLYDPNLFPGQSDYPWYQWPYIEGLRMDEAMHDLALISTGLYGKDLLPQNGAPIRLVVPWKYGFKSIKSIVKIDLVAEMPVSLWMAAAPNEYGFYANVNPHVDHPRWSQATERRVGEFSRRDTLMFNGYDEQVAHLYQDMDLKSNF
ncbi:MAG: protein-methionine-sulfoxide reductase catalytic subunit MsrP [Chloroflexota bacterium]